MSLLPCHRYFPAGASSRTNQSSITRAAFAPTLKARPPEISPFEVTLRSLALRPGSSLTIPRTALSMGFNRFRFPYGCHPSYGNLVPFPAGLAPAEHACLIWTHNVSVDSTANRVSISTFCRRAGKRIGAADENASSSTTSARPQSWKVRSGPMRLCATRVSSKRAPPWREDERPYS